MFEVIPKVSILMTSYNREKYIAAAIESVIASTYDNWELIIVDDGSTDDTLNIAEAYSKKESRIKIFKNEKNLGDYPNRNRAASLATGKYLKYVDSDDMLYPWGLKILVESMEQFPDAGWGLCSLMQDNDQPYPFKLEIEEIFRYHNFKSSLFHKAPLSSIIRKDAFDAVGGFSGKRQIGDTEMWHLLALKFAVVLMPHGIVWYRFHQDQELQNNRDNIEVRMKYPVSTLHFYQNTKSIPLEKKEIEIVISKIKKSIIKEFCIQFISLKFSNCFKIIKAYQSHEFDFKK